jgi:vacuolar-type H+-ATPase subunit E/Vma4
MIIAEAQAQFETMVNESEIMREAEERAAELLNQARQEAAGIRMSSYHYSEDMLLDLQEVLDKKMRDVNEDLRSLQEFLQS